MKSFLFVLIFSVTIGANLLAQPFNDKQRFRVMSYNVENFFDSQRDSVVKPTEFSPVGIRRWTYSRYLAKRNNIAKVIAALGGWTPPALVALCEIENQQILENLTLHSPLRNLHYRIIHFESPDPRGIDVALLYQPKLFKPLHEEPLRIRFPDSPHHHTRDILYVTGTTQGNDTLHIFVNHFPSRYGGELESENSRLFVASILRHKTDSLFNANPQSNIIILGDFNDYPDNRSIAYVLNALPETCSIRPHQLYNLFYTTHTTKKTGSYKHDGEWGVLDQIIVSSHLLQDTSGIHTTVSSGKVFAPLFLLENETKGFGEKPFRTYIGMKYHGGFSDHLPVFVDFQDGNHNTPL
ncbi:endonuclease/exonuclease/phosphatase family protein [Microbacter margulisiae]|uniref:Putative extracellular nuclease n=1 Tax=Microbacter margulisiae TaxID=1350067 RepID=A0A7W5DSH7_9PORP|nr:endonuclease/exonuclease/phosphatase family protein [Microbacter margulisiae]MBB3187423.1 putative extracellular nuclease [Microbacter margulisiae]